MDGSTCAICFQVAGGNKHNVHFANPQHDATDSILKELLDDGASNILLADVSISKEMAETVSQYNSNVVLLDHHKSAIPLQSYDWCQIDALNTACGSQMLFNYLLPTTDGLKKYKELIELVDDHDRWMKNYPESDDLALLHPMIGQSLFIDRFLANPLKQLTSEEKYVISIEKRKMHEEISEKKRVIQSSIFNKTVNGKNYRFGFVTGVKFVSSTGDALYSDPNLNLDCVVMISGVTISMRSSKACELDLSKIAKDHGGGGHKAASGFPIKSLLGMELIDFVASNLKL